MKKTLLALFAAAFVFSIIGVPALARPFPHFFSGNLAVGGAPAAAGTMVEARGVGVITGVPGNPVTTTEVGKYGGPGVAAGVLMVQGDNITDGATLTFFVNGIQAAQTAPWHAGATTNLNLTAAAAPPAPVVLTAATDTPANVAVDSATLRGSLTQLSGTPSATVSFQWGPRTNPNYGNETPGQTVSATGGFTAFVSGLASNTAYHYRAKAASGQTTVFGSDAEFTTAQAPGGGGTGGGGTGGGGTGGGGSGIGVGGGGTSGPPVTVTTTGLKGDVELKVDDSGKSQSQVKLTSTNEGPKHTVEIAANTTMKGKDGAPLTSITMAAPAAAPPAPSQGKVVLTQDLGPNGATFDPPITVTLAFDPAALGTGVKPSDLVMGFFDGTQWITLDTTLDPVNNTLSAKVSHFTVFGVLTKPNAAALPPTSSAPAPAAPVPGPSPTPPASPAPSTSPTAPPAAAPPTSPAAVPASPSTPAQQTGPWLIGAIIGGAAILIAGLVLIVFRRRASAG